MPEVYRLFVDNLTILDAAIWDEQYGPIGMTWEVDVEFIGGLDEEGVVFDFSIAKKTAKKVIDDEADHAFIVPQRLISDDVVTANIPYEFEYSAPDQAYFVVPQVSEPQIATALENIILENLKDHKNITGVTVTLRDPNTEGASYRYTHGLKQHYGNCQRLMHGHKSPIQVALNDVNEPNMEETVASLYHNKHLCFKDNVKKIEDGVVYIEYKSEQGLFSMTLPQHTVVFYPYETTVENISKFTAQYLASFGLKANLVSMQDTVSVRAYEGIGKGSVYTITDVQNETSEFRDIMKRMNEDLGLTPKDPQQLLKG